VEKAKPRAVTSVDLGSEELPLGSHIEGFAELSIQIRRVFGEKMKGDGQVVISICVGKKLL
jgi:hypothetical protein